MPRDPRRIKRICELLQSIWEQEPDLRLGQLLENLSRFNDLFPFSAPNFIAKKYGYMHTWAQEDDVTEKKLEEILKEWTKKD
jgi:hypothetical protein